MAVNFDRNVEELVHDLQQRGMQPAVLKLGGEPPRAAELRVAHNLVVCWDRDSRCVWVEGPPVEAARLEACIARDFQPGWWSRAGAALQSSGGAVLICAVLMLLAGSFIGYLRTQKIPPGVTVAPRSERTATLETDAKPASPAGKSFESPAAGPKQSASAD